MIFIDSDASSNLSTTTKSTVTQNTGEISKSQELQKGIFIFLFI